MKKLFLFWSLLILTTCPLLAQKMRTIKLTPNAIYYGLVEKKVPVGEGELTIQNYGEKESVTYRIKGIFNNNDINEAELILPDLNLVFVGRLSYTMNEDIFTFNKLSGDLFYCLDDEDVEKADIDIKSYFRSSDALDYKVSQNYLEDIKEHKKYYLGTIVGDKNTIIINPESTSYLVASLNILIDYYLSQDDLKLMINFAGTNNYDLISDASILLCQIENGKSSWTESKAQSPAKLNFDNGAVIDNMLAKPLWKRENGDYLVFSNYSDCNTYKLEDYHLTTASGYIERNRVKNVFDNNNSYEGDALIGEMPLRELVTITEYKWEWSEFLEVATSGKLIYFDGEWFDGEFNKKATVKDHKLTYDAYYSGSLYDKSGVVVEKFTEGVSETERKRLDEERKRIEIERNAKYEQEKLTDFYEFNDHGFVVKFKKTFKNAIMNFDISNPKSNEYHVMLTYDDGTSIDFSACFGHRWLYEHNYEGLALIEQSFDGSDGEFYSYTGVPINDWYSKYIKNVMDAPLIDSKEIFGIYLDNNNYEVSFTTSDGSAITVKPKQYILLSKENGDFFRYNAGRIDDYSSVNLSKGIINNQLICGLRKRFEAYTAIYSPNEGLNTYPKNGSDYMCGNIVYDNGEVFKGVIDIKFPYDVPYKHYPSSLDTRALSVLREGGVYMWYDEITAVVPYDGFVYNQNGKIIDAYRQGVKLDDFDKAAVIAAEQGRIDAERKKQADFLAQKQRIISNYGQKNADAFFRGEIVVGMPEELFVAGANNGNFKRIVAAYVSKDYGNAKCYDLYAVRSSSISFVEIGYLWVHDGKVSSIHYY